MMVRTIEQAKGLRKRRFLDEIVVSSDNARILAVAEGAGVDVLRRPRRYATDRASTLSVVRHFLQVRQARGQRTGTVVLLQVTSPLRTDRDIEDCLEEFARGRASSVVTVSDALPKPEWMFRARKGQRGWLGKAIARGPGSPAVALNGAVYVASARHLKTHGFVASATRFVRMPRERSVDVDEPHDLEMARALWKRGSR